jgi:hypothetical protein
LSCATESERAGEMSVEAGGQWGWRRVGSLFCWAFENYYWSVKYGDYPLSWLSTVVVDVPGAGEWWMGWKVGGGQVSNKNKTNDDDED